MTHSINKTTPATQAAGRNFRRNLAALVDRVPGLNAPMPAESEFVFARDGSITAIDSAGRFHRDCSLPLRAAQAQLRTTRVAGQCACMLDPMHAAAVSALLGILRREQAVITVVPNSVDAALLLHCADFTAEIAANRFHLVFGDGWSSQLDRLFERLPGLAIPTHFVRTSDADVTATDELIAKAQNIFGEVTTRRNQQLNELRHEPSDRCSRNESAICVLGGRRFRLWNDAANALHDSLDSLNCTAFDSDDPICTTALALALQLRDSRAVVAADVFRGDAGAAVPEQLPWITWLTKPRIAPPSSSRDVLVATDESLARDAIAGGWPKKRVHIGEWPNVQSASPPNGAIPAIIANVRSLKPPKDLEELSSHRLLWEFIADQIARDPFVAFDRIDELLKQSMKRQNVTADGVPVVRFVDELIVPATAVAVARLLAAHNVPFTIHGDGWQEFSDLESNWLGPIQSRQELHRAVERARSLIQVVPTSRPHAIDAAGRRVIRCERDAKRLIAACTSDGESTPRPNAQPICTEMILNLIQELEA